MKFKVPKGMNYNARYHWYILFTGSELDSFKFIFVKTFLKFCISDKQTVYEQEESENNNLIITVFLMGKGNSQCI